MKNVNKYLELNRYLQIAYRRKDEDEIELLEDQMDEIYNELNEKELRYIKEKLNNS